MERLWIGHNLRPRRSTGQDKTAPFPPVWLNMELAGGIRARETQRATYTVDQHPPLGGYYIINQAEGQMLLLHISRIGANGVRVI